MDISSLAWGKRPVPLLPKSLCDLWHDDPLPAWLTQEVSLPANATVNTLGSQYWSMSSSVTPRLEHYIAFIIKSRTQSILTLRCFNQPWPPGLRISEISFSVRSHNLLSRSGLLNNPDALIAVTFAQLLGIPGLGIKSLIEITTLVESAVELSNQVSSELSAGLGAQVIGESGNQDGSKWRHLLTEALHEPWVDQVSEQDPRFRAVLPVGQGTLEERIERALSDPTSSTTEVPLLVGCLPSVRQIVERLKMQYLEEGLGELLSTALGHKQPHFDLIAARLGWSGEEPKTLQECGDLKGITRERVRQIEQNARKKLPQHPVFLPKLDLGISLLESSAPITLPAAANLLIERGIAKRTFSPVSLLDAAELLGRRTALTISSNRGERMVVSSTGEHKLGSVSRIARKLAGQAGVASVFQVVDKFRGQNEQGDEAIAAPEDFLSEDEVRRVLGADTGCEFLDQDWFWFTDLPKGRNRLENLAKRILSVASPQPIASIREGVRRVFRYRASSNPRYRSLVVPPQTVMASFFRQHPAFRIDGDLVGNVTPIGSRSLLGDGERALVDAIRASAAGVLDRKTLISACMARGINENTLSLYTTYSPLLEHIGLDLWKLRGVRVDPAAVEAVREQNQLRPRETRLLEQGWTPDGKLWIAWKLPGNTSSLVFGVPGAVRRYLANRTFQAVAKDSGRTFGQVSINTAGSSYGYAPVLRYVGADEGDTLLAEFDLTKSEVQISIADTDMLSID